MSHNFIHLLKFNKEELSSEPIDLILPDDLKQVHEKAFLFWLNQNANSSYIEAKYEIKNSSCLAKDN